jgi:ATP-dependent helicase/nuclease subunit A
MPKKRTEPAPEPAFPDGPARQAIRKDLGTTILVEAAAGTGKTSSLVDRMVALVETGATTVEHLSAVTFTIRAAAQLKQRFQNALEEKLRQAQSGAARENLLAALARIDSCFVGTIHAFGARLLRERPVEAGVDPGFTEMDDPEDGAARREAWNRFAEALFVNADPRLARLIELDVPLDSLEDAFRTVCENSDMEIAIAVQPAEPDFSGERAAIEEFLGRAAESLPEEAPAGGWTGFQNAVRRARRLRELLDPRRASDLVRILKVLQSGQAEKGVPGSLKAAFQRLREDAIRPAITRWAEYVYPAVCRVLADAREEYARWRRQEGRLNFQDLLILARDLLRDRPGVRSALRERFTPVLVDEFQDTDPIQAEILFYLTGSDTEERDWKKLVPVPGSLFVVGDPKQSIYRFRRADIQTYTLVRSRIEASGRTLELSTNFRSTPALCGWVNRVFPRQGFFPKQASGEQAGYVALFASRPGEASAPAVFRLETRVPGQAHDPVARMDSARIADVIASAVGAGRRKPEDFLILFRRKKYVALYARALEERGIVPEIGGGGAFSDSEELAALEPLLATLSDPDNPVPLLAALRGPVFGVDDEALYRFARAGGRFSFRAPLPGGVDPRIARAFELFREGASFVETLPPAAAIARFVEKLGWTALAAARDLPDSRAGNLVKALAAARKISADGLDFAGVVAELERLRQEEIEQMSVEPGRPGAVRLMTIHAAKGLESPVVFLADPTGDPGKPRSYCVDRDTEPPRGYFRVAKKSKMREFREEEIARPTGWDALQQRETLFDDAEKVRLLYVGATRASESLIVSVWKRSANKPYGPWMSFDPYLEWNLPESQAGPEPPPAPPHEDPARELEVFRRRRAERFTASSGASYAVTTVTEVAHSGRERPFREQTGKGLSWGSVVHRLLEAVMRDPSLDVRAYAVNVLAEEGRAAEDLDEVVRLVEAVRSSPLWKRALAAKSRMVEVPFALTVPSAELGTSAGPAETLLTGALDLVFEEEDGWRIVDYKSDTIAGNLDDLVAFYKPQIAHYRRYWQQLTGCPTKAGLFFVSTGQEVWLEEP